MPGRSRRIYFDANVFLAFVSDEPGRAAVVEEQLRQSQAGSVAVLTSTVSIAEVAYGAEEKSQQSLDVDIEARIDGLWAPGGPVTLVEASRLVLVTARSLIRSNLALGYGRLTPLDAIHLATALVEKVDTMATYETNACARWATLTGLLVTEPEVYQPPLEGAVPDS